MSTLLSLTVDGRATELVTYIIETGDVESEINSATPTGDFPLLASPTAAVTEILLDGGADPNVVRPDGTSALIVACLRDDANSLTLLLDHGADVNQEAKKVGTPLMACVNSDAFDCFTLLLDHPGVDLNHQDAEGKTALIAAATLGRTRFIEAMLSRKSRLEINTRALDGCTAFHAAAHSGHLEIMRMLHRHGADPDISGYDGKTPLLKAVSSTSCSDEVLQFLLEIGSQESMKHPIVFLAASRAGHLETVKSFLANEPGIVNYVAAPGAPTALALAAESGHADVVAALVAAGADIRIRIGTGETPLTLAARNDNLVCLQLLTASLDSVSAEELMEVATALHDYITERMSTAAEEALLQEHRMLQSTHHADILREVNVLVEQTQELQDILPLEIVDETILESADRLTTKLAHFTARSLCSLDVTEIVSLANTLVEGGEAPNLLKALEKHVRDIEGIRSTERTHKLDDHIRSVTRISDQITKYLNELPVDIRSGIEHVTTIARNHCEDALKSLKNQAEQLKRFMFYDVRLLKDTLADVKHSFEVLGSYRDISASVQEIATYFQRNMRRIALPTTDESRTFTQRQSEIRQMVETFARPSSTSLVTVRAQLLDHALSLVDEDISSLFRVELSTGSSIAHEPICLQEDAPLPIIDPKLLKIIRPLSAGGFGLISIATFVNQAVTPAEVLQVAFKHGLRPEYSQLILSEAALQCQLIHPNIIRVWGVAHDVAVPFHQLQSGIVMELASSSLDVFLKEHSFLTTSQRLKLLLDAAEGLTYLHERRIMHLDLTADNVLISTTPTGAYVAKISDFGISRNYRTTFQTGHLSGKPSFLAPESFRGRPCLSSDVYSFALLILFALQQFIPFQGHDMHQVRLCFAEGRWPSVPRVGIQTLDSLITDAIYARSPDARPSIIEFRDAISEYLCSKS